MRGVLGLVGLLVVLAVVAVGVKQQLRATRAIETPLVAPASDGAASRAIALPANGGASEAQRFSSDVKGALQSDVDRRATESDAAGR